MILAPTFKKIFISCIILFFIPKLLDTYFLMPFPGSMDAETMTFSYWLNMAVNPVMILSGTILLVFIILILVKGNTLKRAGSLLLAILCIVFIYYTQFEFSAEKMFREPATVTFKKGEPESYPADAFIIGVIHEGESKAYPMRYVAYHHKIHDRIGGTDILVTYCSMCRSARVFKPMVKGEPVTFRLVGARHYNAVMEDSKTGSWWYQATGEAAAGPMKGTLLKEFPSEQTTWKAWHEKHPNTLLLQPDPVSIQAYNEWFPSFDEMSPVQNPSGHPKSWIVGLKIHDIPKAYSFQALLKARLIEDKIGPTPVLLTIEDDSLTTHTWFRAVNNRVTHFEMDSSWKFMRDSETGSLWDMNGFCTQGIHQGIQLITLPHYQEYLRSWKYFNPESSYLE